MARDSHRAPDDSGLSALLEPVVQSCGADLEAVEVTRAGQRSRLSVIVDRDGGIDLDGIAEVSKAVSDALDDADAALAGPYTLEVTSPGVDRPLTQPRHWRRNAGRLVVVVLADGSQVTGRVVDADDDALVLSAGDGPVTGDTRRLDWAGIDRGIVQVEFRRPDPQEGPGGEPGPGVEQEEG